MFIAFLGTSASASRHRNDVRTGVKARQGRQRLPVACTIQKSKASNASGLSYSVCARSSTHDSTLMKRSKMNRVAKLACLAVLWNPIFTGIVPSAQGQARPQDAATIARRNATEKELESIAIIDRKVMVPMRDGKRMQADIYRPKDQSKKYPIIFVRTPYNFNYWATELGARREMSAPLEAVKQRYAYIEMNERGRYFSEGDYDILGVPLTDSDDALDWMGGLPWSLDKVGLIGCSSTAEWQLAVASC